MKLALISPFCLLSHTARTDYQLMLPQLLRDPRYTDRYWQYGSDPEQYVIMDNGVAEGEQWAPVALRAAAQEFKVDEVVIPDHMMDAELTMKEVRAWEPIDGIKNMVVIQGTSMDECLWMIEHLEDVEYISTIGIPRHLGKTTGHKDVRLHLVHELYQRYGGRYEIHLLGAQSFWPEELHFAAVSYGSLIRGMDTSMPFNYAYFEERVDSGMYMPRPKNYFDLPIQEFDPEVVVTNVDKMLDWVNAGE